MAGIIFSEGSNVNNSVYGKSQEPIRMFLEKRAEAFEQASIIKEIFNMGTSKHWAEKYTSMTAMDGFKPVGENGAYPVDNMQEGFSKTIEHMTWKDKFEISREIMDDNNLMDLKGKPQQFIAGYYRTREKFGAAYLGAAITGSTSLTYGGKTFDAKTADGVAMLSTAHPSKLDSSSTQSNCFSDAFSADALAAAECAMQGFKGDNGEILDVAPTTIIIPNLYALKKAVFAAIGADKDPATAGSNAFNYVFGRWNIIVWPYLNQFITANTAPWVLMDKNYNETYHGAEWLDRKTLEVKSEIAENDANVWKGYSRFGVGFNDWRAFSVGGVTGGTQLIST